MLGKPCSFGMGLSFWERDREMDIGHFYFLTDQYFIDFPDEYLMKNKEVIGGIVHDRPCFFAFQDGKTGLYWMIPFSSKVEKYKTIYEQKIKKYGKCDTIAFGDVLGHEKAFLIQNMCPITTKYVKNQYIDSVSSVPVRLNGAFERQLIRQARKVLTLQRRGAHLIFPDVLGIEESLLGTACGATP